LAALSKRTGKRFLSAEAGGKIQGKREGGKAEYLLLEMLVFTSEGEKRRREAF